MQTHSAESEMGAAVRETSGAVATGRQEGCCGSGTGCCGPTGSASSVPLNDCCPPDAKPGCCEQSPQAASCGCQAPANPRR
jgi:hypothetical protein